MEKLNQQGFIRQATESDIEVIHHWLLEHERNEVHGTFLCNWNLTLNVYNEGNLFVYIDSEINKPIAYAWKDLGIVEVKEDKRGHGVGRKIVEYIIHHAQEPNNAILRIECIPYSSIPFWEHMGFKIYSNNYAFLVLHKLFSLPKDGMQVTVEIKFYPEQRKWDSTICSLSVFVPNAVKTKDGVIHLDERVIFFNSYAVEQRDPVVGIYIDGVESYLDKAKYPEAISIGVQSGFYAFYIDKISIP